MSKFFKVGFTLRSNRVDEEGKVPVLIRISLRGNRADLGYAGCRVNPTNWVPKTRRVKSGTKGATAINNELDRIENDINHIYRQLEFDKELSVEVIRDKFLGKDTQEAKESFIGFYSNYIERVKSEIGVTRVKASWQKFNVVFKHFTAFIQQKYHKKEFYIKDIKFGVIDDFFLYLQSEGGLCHNTAMKAMQTFKTVVIYARKQGLLTVDPFADFKIRFVQVDRGFLTDEELKEIMDHKFGIARLELVRDMFVFSCFTGLAYIDVANLTPENIIELNGRLWIMTRRQKTDVPSRVLLLDVPMDIIRKYGGKGKDGKLFPILSNQKCNSYLKEIADVCGINKNVSFHLARHTFATLALSKGVTVESVSKMLGHTKISTTQIYAKITNKKIEGEMLDLASQLGDFKFTSENADSKKRGRPKKIKPEDLSSTYKEKKPKKKNADTADEGPKTE